MSTEPNKLKNVDLDVKAKVVDALNEADPQSFRKNLVASIVLSTVFLIAGWLLSIVATPATLTTLFHH